MTFRLFKERYDAEVIVFRSEGRPDYFIQREEGVKNEELKVIAKDYINCIVNGAPIGVKGKIYVYVPRSEEAIKRSGLVGMLNIRITKGRKNPEIVWTKNLIVKKKGILD